MIKAIANKKSGVAHLSVKTIMIGMALTFVFSFVSYMVAWMLSETPDANSNNTEQSITNENVTASTNIQPEFENESNKNNGKNIKNQAEEIKTKLNKGKNSVTIKTKNGHIRYDLSGKQHGSIKTPHKQVYKNNMVNGKIKSVSRASKFAEPMTQSDIDFVREFLLKTVIK